MGARSNIRLTYENGKQVCFYTHWDGARLPEILKEALERGKPRWDDAGYLARIIFSEMIKDEVLSLTGFGIYTDIGEENYRTLDVDLDAQTVNDVPFADYIDSAYKVLMH